MRTGAERVEGDGASGSAVVRTRWGVVGLVESGGAVVFLTLADDATAARKALEDALPEEGPDERAVELAEGIARRIEAGKGFEGIPFEVAGTEFQELVWGELVRIPRGEVVTYGELARRVGRPGAVRAVGSACGANPVALLVPCHRVVTLAGTVGGYRWGEGRKTVILGDEGVALPVTDLRLS